MSKFFKNIIISLVIICGLCISIVSKNVINTSSKNTLSTFTTLKTTNASNNLNTKEYNWYFKHVKNGVPPVEPPETANFLSKYDTHFLGDTSKKVIYLTFDEGYENGYTGPDRKSTRLNSSHANISYAVFCLK